MSSSPSIARRLFWRQLATDVFTSDPQNQKIRLNLEDLPSLSSEHFFGLIPQVVEGVQFSVHDWKLIAERTGSPQTVCIGAWLPVESWLLNQFDGTRSLWQIARLLAVRNNWDELISCNFMREFFTRLAISQVVVPVNCPKEIVS